MAKRRSLPERLMAEAGIVYFFEHSESAHTLVMADSPDVFADCPQGCDAGMASRRAGQGGGAAHGTSAHVLSFRCHGRLLRLLVPWMTIIR